MPSTQRATIVVVTYNHQQQISSCLEALRPTLTPEDEVIVVDNASSDGTAELVGDRYPWVRLIRSDTNGGFGAACNTGAAHAHGRFLVFLNPDTEPCAGWLDPLLAALQSVPDAGLATAKLLLARSPDLIDTFGNEVHISGITTSRAWGEPAASHSDLEEVTAVSGACFAIPRDVFHKLGGFDERLFLYYEDTDLSLRARLAGYRCIAVPGARVLHDHKPGFPPAKLRYLERNRVWVLLKLYSGRSIMALIPVLAIAELAGWALALRSGPRHLAAKLLAYADLARWLPSLSSIRRATNRTRSESDYSILRAHTARLRFAQVASGGVAVLAENFATVLFGRGRALLTRMQLKEQDA